MRCRHPAPAPAALLPPPPPPFVPPPPAVPATDGRALLEDANDRMLCMPSTGHFAEVLGTPAEVAAEPCSTVTVPYKVVTALLADPGMPCRHLGCVL